MANENITFRRGLSENLPDSNTPGQILFETDTGNMYVDDSSTSRIQVKDDTKLPLSGGTLTGSINMGNNKITSLSTPTVNTDAANKSYVDTQSKYTAGTSIIISNKQISHSNVGTASTVGPTGNSSPGYGGTFVVPQVATNAQGHVSTIVSRTITMPAAQTLASLGVTATAAELNKLDGATVTVTELNYLDGVTSAIQTQLNNKASNTDMKGATTSAAGTHGLVPAPSAGSATRYLRSDGTWSVPPNTTYSVFTGANTSTAGSTGLVPAPSAGASTRYLRSDGTWTTPPDTNTTYTAGTALTLSSNQFSHNSYGTSGTYGPSTNDTLAFGDTFTGLYITTNAQGHVTAAGTRTFTLPSAPTSVSGNAGTATTLATSRAIDGVNFNGSAAIIHYGTCSTAAATAAKTVSCTGFTRLTGARICVKFTVTNTAAFPTLNVNSTGAAPIYYRGGTIVAGTLAANRTYEFVYNGTQYELVGDIDTNTTYSAGTGLSLSSNTFSHQNYGTAETIGPSANSSPGYGGTFVVPQITTNAQGHVIELTARTITMPSATTLSTLGITATAAEINKLDGITATTAELNYVDGVTSNIQTQLNGKQATISGGASTITSSNLTVSRALISNSSGKVAVSSVTSTELSYLDGVTSSIQTQLNGKAASSHTHNYAGSASAGGPANTALALNTARTISLSGDVTGSTSFNGSTNVSIASTVMNHSAEAIPANSDLNDYKDPGWYYCSLNPHAATMNNCPTTYAFSLIVNRHAGTNQILITYSPDANIRLYTRNYYGNTWSSWYRIFTQADMPLSSTSSAGFLRALSGSTTQFLRGDGTWATPANTTYSAGTGLSLSGTSFSLATSGVTAGSYGPTANVSGTNGSTINVPQITVDAYGRVTSVINRVLTNRDTNTTYSVFDGATASAAGTSGLVPAPASGYNSRFLRGDGTWVSISTTDTMVTQTSTSTNATYYVLFSGTNSTTTNTTTARKSSRMSFNPGTGLLTVTKIDAIIDDGALT